jgi:hypothetical protein
MPRSRYFYILECVLYFMNNYKETQWGAPRYDAWGIKGKRHVPNLQVVREQRALRGGFGGSTLSMWDVTYDKSGRELKSRLIGDMPVLPDESFEELVEIGKRLCVLYGEGMELHIIDMENGKKSGFYNRSGNLEFL